RRSSIEGALNDADVGLGFRVIAEPNGILNAHASRALESGYQQLGEFVDALGMTDPDRIHLDDFPFDEFDAIAGRKNPHLGHAVEFVDRESAVRQGSNT